MNIPIYINLASDIPVSQSLHLLGAFCTGPVRRRRSMSLPEKPTKSIEEKPMEKAKDLGTLETFLALDLLPPSYHRGTPIAGWFGYVWFTANPSINGYRGSPISGNLQMKIGVVIFLDQRCSVFVGHVWAVSAISQVAVSDSSSPSNNELSPTESAEQSGSSGRFQSTQETLHPRMVCLDQDMANSTALLPSSVVQHI